MNGPTTREFTQLFHHLADKLDPGHKQNPNIQDYVQSMMMRFGYQLGVNKGALQSIGSSHTWPHLLAVLHWMVELLQYEQEKNHAAEFTQEDPEKAFFRTIQNAYGTFLKGDDDDVDKIDREVDEQFELRDASVSNDVQTLSEENTELLAQIEMLQNEEADRETIFARRDDMLLQRNQYEQSNEELQGSIVKSKGGLEEKLEEMGALKQEIAELEADKAERLKSVSQQEMSVGDMAVLREDMASITTEKRRLQEEKETCEVEMREAEEATNNKLAEVEDAVQQHERLAEELKLIPSCAKYAKGIDFSLAFDRTANMEAQMLDKDLKHVLRPRLVEVKSALGAKLNAVEDDTYLAQEKLDAVAGKIADHT